MFYRCVPFTDFLGVAVRQWTRCSAVTVLHELAKRAVSSSTIINPRHCPIENAVNFAFIVEDCHFTLIEPPETTPKVVVVEDDALWDRSG